MRKVLTIAGVILAALLALGAIICLVLWWRFVLVHLSQETGTSNGSSRAYSFWSGFGSDIGEVVVIGGLITLVRHVNCHTRGCWRLGKHPVEGTPYKVCRKHHPQVPNQGATLAEIHQAASNGMESSEG